MVKEEKKEEGKKKEKEEEKEEKKFPPFLEVFQGKGNSSGEPSSCLLLFINDAVLGPHLHAKKDWIYF